MFGLGFLPYAIVSFHLHDRLLQTAKSPCGTEAERWRSFKSRDLRGIFSLYLNGQESRSLNFCSIQSFAKLFRSSNAYFHQREDETVNYYYDYFLLNYCCSNF